MDVKYKRKPIFAFIKRLFDFFSSLIGLIGLIPVFLIVSILVKCSSKGPVIFKQKRVGKNEKEIYIHKFRTMRIDAPSECPPYELENPYYYITKIGKFLRKTSIDELPQLLDILIGKMSVIGPRPCTFTENELIELRRKNAVFNVKPGLTGLAQIKGRDCIEIETKAEIDGYYVKKRNVVLDISILFRTVFYVLFSRGVREGKVEEKNEEKNEAVA